MTGKREGSKKSRRASLLANSRHRILHSTRLQPPIMWNIQGMRGQMSSNCLWHACKALLVGMLIFSGGAAMCVIGFYNDGLLGEGAEEGGHSANSTGGARRVEEFHFDPGRRQVRLSQLSYIGPIVMGIGGFIIVATCVMTFEARDSAAKVGPSFVNTATKVSSALPLAIPLIMSATGATGGGGGGGGGGGRGRKTSADVRSVASQTMGSINSLHTAATAGPTLKFDKKIIVEAFRKFSRTLRTSASISSSTGGDEEQMQRYPSAPSLLSSTLAANKGGGAGGGVVEEKSSPFVVQSPRYRSPTPRALRHSTSIDTPSPSSPSSSSSYAHSHAHAHSILKSSSSSAAATQHKRTKFKRHVSVPIEQGHEEGVEEEPYYTSNYYTPQQPLGVRRSPVQQESSLQSCVVVAASVHQHSSSPPPPPPAPPTPCTSRSPVPVPHHYLSRAVSEDLTQTPSKQVALKATRRQLTSLAVERPQLARQPQVYVLDQLETGAGAEETIPEENEQQE